MGCEVIQASRPSEERQSFNHLMLNELFMAEKVSSKTSTYLITADGMRLGRFKSSGVIISTGTGSSGWLYGAKRSANTNVKDIATELLEILKKENCEIT